MIVRPNKTDSHVHDSGNGMSPIAVATLFAIPKPFRGHVGTIQRNAIISWLRLRPTVNIVLMGDDEGVREVAQEFSLDWIPELECNRHGTPLVNDAIHQIMEVSESPLLAYCNSDVILLKNFAGTIKRLHRDVKQEFLAIGRRTNTEIDRPVDFENVDEIDWLMQQALSRPLESIMCKDYFLFSRDLYQSIPEFAVGRGNWDNWMVRNARISKAPVIDVTACVTAIHQNHDYSHVAGGRKASYVSGAEAKQNQHLAGGKHWISGSSPTWKLTAKNLKPQLLPWLYLPFWSDMPRISRLVRNLLVSK